MSGASEREAETSNTADMLCQFIALPRARQLTFMRYCLEAFAAGAMPEGVVARSMLSEMEHMDEVWNRKMRRNARRRLRPNLFIVPNLGDHPDEPSDPPVEKRP